MKSQVQTPAQSGTNMKGYTKIFVVTLLIATMPFSQAYSAVAEFDFAPSVNQTPIITSQGLDVPASWSDLPIKIGYDTNLVKGAADLVNKMTAILDDDRPVAIPAPEIEILNEAALPVTSEVRNETARHGFWSKGKVIVAGSLLVAIGLLVGLLMLFASGGSGAGSGSGSTGWLNSGGIPNSGGSPNGILNSGGTPNTGGNPNGGNDGNQGNGNGSGSGSGGGGGGGTGGGSGGGAGGAGGGDTGTGGLPGGGSLPTGSIPHNPEPSTLLLIGFGLLLPLIRKKK
ncbi:MAG: PEP-CTERM sorting domain-containing protein [Candidatus Omnitrophica bacterium]|nr:PEP-CTERM sorting domain-containing protein [Candidatus Omnitrophota bacterium]MDD5670892.1 PEP-CTERM sorting domain-containing protein [Candidatus Omnitrophota bacterium]